MKLAIAFGKCLLGGVTAAAFSYIVGPWGIMAAPFFGIAAGLWAAAGLIE